MDNFDEIINNANQAILSVSDKDVQRKLISEMMDMLRIKYNEKPKEFPWEKTCDWYTSIQKQCEMPYIDTFACLYPSILNVKKFKKFI
ncbi:MAG: hypothetical protein [Wendovervirus sonii]|uniref:Uncharacterized protein n=1 Tax=phage Lak_Megaphage_Sonny TaxID=3109229 RepID=A0ABZ0Z5Q7_9CAUD|nr:MAG: hypothetical protein [phage Lak_Megaphage_Sonny]